jgi:hypothetical protein
VKTGLEAEPAKKSLFSLAIPQNKSNNFKQQDRKDSERWRQSRVSNAAPDA